jgi:putative nucleotidyltransferase with HDIG domain
MLPVIVEQLVVLLNCETVSIEIIDPLTGDAITEAAHGIWAALIGKHQKRGTGINAIISQTRQPYFTNDLKNDPHLAYPEWTHNDIHGGIGAPLIAQDQLIGFAWMGRKSEIVEDEIRLFTATADIAANALHRATLYEQSQKDAAELVLAYDSTLEGWAHALELRDQETEGHSRRVVQMTVELASKMGVGTHEMENVRRGALLHDIGKMGIPDSILLKPGTLNEREWEIMRRHPEYAYQFLEPIDYLRPVIDIPYSHHEKWDGSGYPCRLTGAEIPFVARIFAIVDVWDALRSDRPYRTAWTKEKTRQYIIEQSGIHFDPQVVQAFMELLAGNNDRSNG